MDNTEKDIAMDPYTVSTEVTAAQANAIQKQAAIYDTDDAPNCDGLESYKIEAASEWGDSSPEGAVAASFNYRYPGEDVTGLEVTIFDREGNVVTSQDFG